MSIKILVLAKEIFSRAGLICQPNDFVVRSLLSSLDSGHSIIPL